MTKEKLIALSDLNREDNIKYISSEAQGIAITLDSDRYAPNFCKLERAYICGRRKSEEQIEQLEKENAELKKEWQEQVQKATDEGYARTLQTIQLTKAKEVMNIAIEGIKCWGIVGGTERPFEKQAEKLFNLFLEKAEQFIKDSEVEK